MRCALRARWRTAAIALARLVPTEETVTVAVRIRAGGMHAPRAGRVGGLERSSIIDHRSSIIDHRSSIIDHQRQHESRL
jgi:hypothetical protein